MNKTLTDLAHEIYAAAQTVPGEGIEDAASRIEAILAAQQPEPRAEVKPRKVERDSDMSVLVVFCSTREASVFEKEIRARAGGA